MHLVLTIKDTPKLLSRSAWVSYFEQCQGKKLGSLSTHFSLIADYLLSKERIERDKLATYLKNQLSSREILDLSKRKRILSLFHKKRDVRKTGTVRRFCQLDDTFPDKKESEMGASDFFNLNELINDFEKSHNQLLSSLVSLRVALTIGNKSWASELLESIIHYDFYRYIFDIEYEVFTNQKQKENYKKTLLETLRSILESTEDEKMGIMLLQNFANYFESEELQSLRVELNAIRSLKFMRKQLDSESYGKPYLSFWYSTLHGRTTTNEIFTFMQEALTEERLKTLPIQSFWVFDLFFPNQEKKREIIYKRIQKALHKNSPYIQHLMIRLAEKDILRGKMGEWSEEYQMALFQIKRKFYRDQLEQGNLIHFAIYQLVRMGDYDPYHLWWLAL